MLEVNRSHSPALPAMHTAAPFVQSNFRALCCGGRLCGHRGRGVLVNPPAWGSTSQCPQTLYGPRSGHLPPAELCRWTWPSVSFGQGKKGALLKEADLSITLLCRHGAFIAFLSTSPYPFLNHNNSPPPHRPSSQETWCLLFISTDTCIQCRHQQGLGTAALGPAPAL